MRWFRSAAGPWGTAPGLGVGGREALLPSRDALPFGPEEAEIAARLYREVTRPRGREVHLAIAATSLAWHAPLWTLNRADFQDVPGLRVIG